MDDAFGFDEPADASGARAAEPELFYPTLDDFVREHVRFKYRRLVGRAGRADLRWNSASWGSEEALSRLETRWRGWENARQDPIKMGDWWLNQFDWHMAVLLSSTGPFAASEDENKPGYPLPYTPPPPGFFSPGGFHCGLSAQGKSPSRRKHALALLGEAVSPSSHANYWSLGLLLLLGAAAATPAAAPRPMTTSPPKTSDTLPRPCTSSTTAGDPPGPCAP